MPLSDSVRCDPFDVWRHLRDRCGAQFVIGAKHVEDGRRIGQKMLTALLGQADCVRQHHHRVDFGAVGDGVEADLSRELLRELTRRLSEARAQRSHHRCGQGAIEHAARPVMFGRVALQHHARRPPRLLALKVAQTHAATRTEGHWIIEDLPDLGVPRRCISAVLFEPHDRSGLPQRFVRGMRIAEEIERERIERSVRNPSGRPPRRGRLRHGDVSSKEPGCRRR